MIAIFDEDGGGDVDFQEFVSGLSAFSSKGNKEEKLRFAFKVYDIDRDGYISNGELFIVLKMMVGSNLKDQQLQQIVDKTIMEADLDRDGKISFDEFTKMVENTDVSMSMTLGEFLVLARRMIRLVLFAFPGVQRPRTSSRWTWARVDAAVYCCPPPRLLNGADSLNQINFEPSSGARGQTSMVLIRKDAEKGGQVPEWSASPVDIYSVSPEWKTPSSTYLLE